MKRTPWIVACAALTVGILMAPAAADAKDKVSVCKHGCDYRTIQDAVDHTGKKAVINVEPGTYKEGVLIEGSKHDGVTIQGNGHGTSFLRISLHILCQPRGRLTPWFRLKTGQPTRFPRAGRPI